MKTIDKIWLERFHTLNRLNADIKMLLKSNMPKRQKIAIWYRKFDCFVQESLDQDWQIRTEYTGEKRPPKKGNVFLDS